MAQPIVKARTHHGTKSLDLTIPVEIAEEYKIHEGDVFSIEVSDNKSGQLYLTYVRIFKQKD
jgi:bifunctional DNA-binding transcriptional regulator/antitoxin component of YhaV-PrlF toxin-antitoxin module